MRAIIVEKKTGLVVNAVPYDKVPTGRVPGFPKGHFAVAHDRAEIGDTYIDGEWTPAEQKDGN